MFDEVRSAVATLEVVVRDFDPRTVDGPDAVTLVELFARVERLGVAGKALAASWIAETGAYRESGHRSAGELLAGVSGSSVGGADSMLRAMKRIEEQPIVDDALRAGELSEVQAKEISAAVAESPESAERLVGLARKRRPLKRLKQECARVIAASVEDDEAWARRLHESRRLFLWHADGALEGSLRLAPDRAVSFHAAVEAETDRLFRDARREGRREPRSAYMADAIANLVERGPAKPIDARVDVPAAALERGHVVEGEACEIPGLGPIPVASARMMLRDARVTVLLRGDDDRITHVSSVTRTVPAKLRRWLEATYPVCGRQGCHNTIGLRIDHIHEYAKGGVLDEHNAWRICGPCDHLKQHEGWKVIGTPGHYDLVPPDHPAPPARHLAPTGTDPP
jgi:5-methylcytosine-specific restriction endonuclease McrA